ncbi:MAG: response regulator [Deltaproteobacteria bacterium]
MGHVFVLDDEPQIGFIINRYMTAMGFSVTSSSDPVSALETLKSDRHFDLLILDMKMPKMSGMDILTSLKEAEFDLPVILLTGVFDSEKYAADLRALGYNIDIVTKPVDLQVLLNIMRQKLGRK